MLFEIFNSVSQTNSLTKTAEIFGITQPAVTHNIKKLENIVGIPLVSRTNRGIQLTEAGNEYLTYVRSVLSTLSDANLRMKNLADGRNGCIRIAIVPGTYDYLIRDIHQYNKIFPDIQIDVELFEGPELINTYSHNSFDFYYTTEDQIEGREDYSYIPIGKGSLCLYKNKDLPAFSPSDENQPSVEFQLISVPLTDIQLANPIKNLLDTNNISYKLINYYKRTESVLLAVSAGLGISILPDSLTKYYSFPNITTEKLKGGFECITYVLAWNNHLKSSSCKLFKETITALYSREHYVQNK